MRNPFTPTFGIVPPYLAGRDNIIKEIKKAFIDWQGNPNISTILIGPRGSGKTAMLSYIGDCAKEEGWIVADTVASDGMLEDLLQRALDGASATIHESEKRKLTSLSIGNMIGLSWTNENDNQANWRSKITALLKELNAKDIGLLLTVDEVRADVDEMIQLASIYQLLIREGAKVSLVMAGLPAQVGNLVSDQSVSFLRRASQQYLGNISDTDIRTAIRRTIESEGKTIDDEALEDATTATAGFAYMMQLVGYHVWESSGSRQDISVEDVRKGISLAEKDFRKGVLYNTYMELSKGDVAFLTAMLEDDDSSSISQIAERLGKTAGHTSTYKKRMLQAGIIKENAGHTFAFAMPRFREYLMDMLS